MCIKSNNNMQKLTAFDVMQEFYKYVKLGSF